MCTYGQGVERLLTHTYGQGSCTWLGQNGETASSSCSWGANQLGRNSRWKRGLAYRRTVEMALCSTDHGRNGILFIGRALAYRKMEETDFCWTSYGRNGVMLIRRGVAYRKTGLHGILFISTVDPLQPPRATVHPPSTSSSLHLRLFIHGLLFIQPPPRATPLATVQPALSTGSCSTTPPRATVHPALHRLLFNQPSTGSCSSSPPRGPVHPRPTGLIDRGPVHPAATPRGPVHPTPTKNCSSKPPNNAHCSPKGSIDRL